MTTAADISILDDRWGWRWNINRLRDSRWSVQMGRPSDDNGWTAEGATIEEALANAVASGPPVPIIPRPPTVINRADLTVVRDGSKWTINDRGARAAGNFATKTKALEACNNWVAVSAESLTRWTATHGAAVDGKIEGVDYRWGHHSW